MCLNSRTTGGVPPSDALIPAWLDRVGALLVLTIVGTVAAWGAVWADACPNSHDSAQTRRVP